MKYCSSVDRVSVYSKRNGFSLIELMVVLLLISLVMVSVTIQWSGIYRNATFQSEVERIKDADFKARRHATNVNRACRLIFNFDSQTIGSSRWVDGKEKLVQLKLDGQAQLSSIRGIDESASNGKWTLPITKNGAAPTYAVEISHGGKSKWVLFAGRTGQTTMIDEMSQVDAIFRSLRVQNTSQ